ncbi:hypothetical protein HEK131_59970 [Streptomyces seoulensis]|nr:hypothetical protein HEK131_59970 [Streptomyces seoulensis]
MPCERCPGSGKRGPGKGRTAGSGDPREADGGSRRGLARDHLGGRVGRGDPSEAGLHGHKYAIDAMLCATALQHPGRVTILTSDVEDIGLLTAEHPRLIAEKV